MNTGITSSILSFLMKGSNSDMKHLKVGDPAPAFEGVNEKGETVKLADFKGKKLALFFYPASGTPSCTAEACSLRDHYQDLKEKGIEILGVSPDTVKKQQGFIKKHEFPYSLIADTDLKILNEFGVWGPKKFMGREFDGVHRTTFLIDENGKIEHIVEKVESANHAAQLLNLV
jgi:thioredoxin-dependent peroxiredoxin